MRAALRPFATVTVIVTVAASVPIDSHPLSPPVWFAVEEVVMVVIVVAAVVVVL